MGLYNQSADHFIYNILEKDKGFFVEGGFYKGYNNQFNFWINYNNKTIDESEEFEKEFLDLNQTDFSYIRLGSQYTYDTRDIYIDPNSGIFFNIGLTGLFGLNETENIYEMETYFSTYKNLYKSYLSPVFKYSLFSKFQHSASELPIFKKEYIGGQNYIRGYSPIPSENSMSNSRELIEVDNFSSIQKDIRNLHTRDFKDIDAVIDLAGISNDPSCDLDPIITNSINHQGALHCAQIAKKSGVKRYIMASSCSIYGANSASQLSEDSPTNPISLYAESKINAEKSIAKLSSQGFCVTFLRLATVYGLSLRMRFDLIVNIPRNYSRDSVTDGYLIRRKSVDLNIPLITNVQIAKIMAEALDTYTEDDLKIKDIDSYF